MAEDKQMRCRRVLELLPRFIENDFSPEESASIFKHLEGCPSCRAEYEAMVHLVDTLEAIPAIGVPPSFKDAVMRRIPTPEGGEPEE